MNNICNQTLCKKIVVLANYNHTYTLSVSPSIPSQYTETYINISEEKTEITSSTNGNDDTQTIAIINLVR